MNLNLTAIKRSVLLLPRIATQWLCSSAKAPLRLCRRQRLCTIFPVHLVILQGCTKALYTPQTTFEAHLFLNMAKLHTIPGKKMSKIT